MSTFHTMGLTSVNCLQIFTLITEMELDSKQKWNHLRASCSKWSCRRTEILWPLYKTVKTNNETMFGAAWLVKSFKGVLLRWLHVDEDNKKDGCHKQEHKQLHPQRNSAGGVLLLSSRWHGSMPWDNWYWLGHVAVSRLHPVCVRPEWEMRNIEMRALVSLLHTPELLWGGLCMIVQTNLPTVLNLCQFERLRSIQ